MTEKEKKSAEPKEVPTVRNVYQRISDVMADVGYLQRDKDIGGQYKSVSFGAFAAKVREALLKHGLIVIPSIRGASVRHLPQFTKKTNREGVIWKEADAFRTECHIDIRIVNIDNPSEAVELVSFGAGIDEQDKDPGKALTYALKHGLMKLFLIETGEDEKSPFAAPDVETLTEEQTKKLRELAAEAKLSEEKIVQSVGANSLDEVPVEKFDELVAGLNQRIARIKEKEAKKTAGEKKPEGNGASPSTPA